VNYTSHNSAKKVCALSRRRRPTNMELDCIIDIGLLLSSVLALHYVYEKNKYDIEVSIPVRYNNTKIN